MRFKHAMSCSIREMLKFLLECSQSYGSWDSIKKSSLVFFELKLFSAQSSIASKLTSSTFFISRRDSGDVCLLLERKNKNDYRVGQNGTSTLYISPERLLRDVIACLINLFPLQNNRDKSFWKPRKQRTKLIWQKHIDVIVSSHVSRI